jgi:hypothetical protein
MNAPVNAPIITEFRAAQASREAARDTGDDREKMEQIRELVLGDYRRQTDARLTRIESKLDALAARLEAMSGEIDSERRTAFDALSKGVLDLGEQIRRITKT